MATLVSKQRNSSECWFRASRSFLTRLNDRKFSVVKAGFPRLLVCSLQSQVSLFPQMLFLFRSSNCLHYLRFHQSSLGFQRLPSLLKENKQGLNMRTPWEKSQVLVIIFVQAGVSLGTDANCVLASITCVFFALCAWMFYPRNRHIEFQKKSRVEANHKGGGGFSLDWRRNSYIYRELDSPAKSPFCFDHCFSSRLS